MVSEDELLAQRRRLQQQHKLLEQQIKEQLAAPVINQLKIQRLKKEKLFLRDQLAQIESELFPDIIA